MNISFKGQQFFKNIPTGEITKGRNETTKKDENLAMAGFLLSHYNDKFTTSENKEDGFGNGLNTSINFPNGESLINYPFIGKIGLKEKGTDEYKDIEVLHLIDKDENFNALYLGKQIYGIENTQNKELAQNIFRNTAMDIARNR